MVEACRGARIVYMGNPEFAVAPLRALREAGCRVEAVVTSPPRPAGRGRRLRETEVASYARQEGLRLLQPESFTDGEFLSVLRSLDLDLGVVTAFRMLPRAVWAMPRRGTFNLHTSLLPAYRGAAPVNWAIMNGERETGVTTFLLDEGMDSGGILLRASTEIQANDTSGTLHARLASLGAELVVSTAEGLLAGTLRAAGQPSAEGLPTAPKIYRASCRVEWTRSAAEVDCKIRGLSPLPTAWCGLQLGGQQLDNVKLYLSSRGVACRRGVAGEPGSARVVGRDEGIAVLCGDGEEVCLESLQLPGRNRLGAADFLRGCKGASLHFN